MTYSIFPLADRALSLSFGEIIAPEVNDQVIAAAKRLSEGLGDAVEELVPTYCTLLVHYRAEAFDYAEMEQRIAALLSSEEELAAVQRRIVTIPVCYGGEYGPDIATVAEHGGLSEEEVVRLHTAADYRVYMLGFIAGFPYLGGLSRQLHTPRLSQPRLKIEAGSVGIAGGQTGVYPVASPGGWQIIGRTPLALYDPGRRMPALLNAGDTVRFSPISRQEFLSIAEGEQSWDLQ